MNSRSTVLVVGAAVLMSLPGRTRAQERVTLPEGSDKALVSAVCSQCHELEPLFYYKADDRRWEILVHEMVSFGAHLSPEERDAILSYLKASFSSDARRTGAGATRVSTSKGHEIVDTACSTCHGLSVIERKRSTRAGWEALLRRHTAEKRVELSPADADSVVAYLSAKFAVAPPKR